MSGYTDLGWAVGHYQVDMRVEHSQFGHGFVTGVHESPGTPGVGVEFPGSKHRAFYVGGGSLRVEPLVHWCCGRRAALGIERILPSGQPPKGQERTSIEVSDDCFESDDVKPLLLLSSWFQTHPGSGISLIAPASRLSAMPGKEAYAVASGRTLVWRGPISLEAIDRSIKSGSWLTSFEVDD